MSFGDRRSSALLDKDDEVFIEITTDDVLEQVGIKSWQIWKVFVLTSFSWAIVAPLAMIGAFVDDPSCESGQSGNLSAACVKAGSLIAEFELIDDRSHLKHWFTSAFMFGNIIGGSIISPFSDRYGRRIVVVFCLIFQGISSCFGIFAVGYFAVLILRFLQGIFFTGCGIAVWILGYESVCPVLRPYVTFVFGATWVIGYCAVAPLAYYVTNWRWLMFDIGLPCIIYGILLAFFLPESLHFLVTKNRQKQADSWVRKAASEKVASHVDWDSVCQPNIRSTHEPTIFSEIICTLLTRKELIFRILIFAFIWWTDVLVYFGMSLFSVTLVGNRFFNFVAIGLIEIPAVATGPILLDKIGRRLTVSFTHFGTALAFILATFTFTSSPTAQLLFWLMAKFSIAAAFMCIFAFASEFFPTSERNLCIGICSVIGKLLGSCAPFIQMTSSFWTPLPLVIFASFSATAGFLALFLPETTHKQLPDSFEKIRN